MGEFDETSIDTSVDTSDSVDTSSESIDIGSSEVEADYAAAEAEANAEYAAAEAEAEYATTESEAEANVEYAAAEEGDNQSDIPYNFEGDENLSPAELYEKFQKEMYDAQQDAEEWADSQGMDQWSDGTPRDSSLNTEFEEDVSADNTANDIPYNFDGDENLSPAELYEQSQQKMQEAQQDAEDWADSQHMTRWSDGTIRDKYNYWKENE